MFHLGTLLRTIAWETASQRAMRERAQRGKGWARMYRSFCWKNKTKTCSQRLRLLIITDKLTSQVNDYSCLSVYGQMQESGLTWNHSIDVHIKGVLSGALILLLSTPIPSGTPSGAAAVAKSLMASNILCLLKRQAIFFVQHSVKENIGILYPYKIDYSFNWLIAQLKISCCNHGRQGGEGWMMHPSRRMLKPSNVIPVHE